ncbi:MAG: CCA tRNA nucleotidyltransferase [Ruminococcaceae bacterium]|nr:CCA tRNA nucleotidyltransferase [Oscillospiraceae bacterium]
MNTKIINLPDEISLALKTLNQKGFKAYLVGGAVRDFLMGSAVSDFDITTDATPDEIHSLFQKCIDTGLSHGTVTVIINHVHIEITTFRQDGNYIDHRRPESISYSKNLCDDLSRRDFTINALAYNPSEGIIDMYGGIDDIKNRILRCVGCARTRFEEDALRMLRLIRFCAKLGFDTEKDTLLALINKQHLIEYVSKERIREEIIKTLLADYPEKMLTFSDSKILDYVFGNDFFEIIKESDLIDMKSLPKLHTLRIAYILNKLYKQSTDSVKAAINNLKFSNNEKKEILDIVSIIRKYMSQPNKFTDKYTLKKAMAKYSIEHISMSFYILSLYYDISHVQKIFGDIINTQEPYLISHLNINGKDLLNMGFKGIDTGDCLKYLIDKVTKNPSLNTKEILTKEAEKYYAEKCICKD